MVSTEVRTQVEQLLSRIADPEVPVINIVELGIIRDIQTPSPDILQVTITPTYSGCPAMDFIIAEMYATLATLGYRQVEIVQSLAPVWTTDWMTDEARYKLQNYGIAPPRLTSERESVACPHCASQQVSLVSQFGSTSCKALYKCGECAEPFEYFKCI